jgi:hypothetical protein
LRYSLLWVFLGVMFSKGIIYIYRRFAEQTETDFQTPPPKTLPASR